MRSRQGIACYQCDKSICTYPPLYTQSPRSGSHRKWFPHHRMTFVEHVLLDMEWRVFRDRLESRARASPHSADSHRLMILNLMSSAPESTLFLWRSTRICEITYVNNWLVTFKWFIVVTTATSSHIILPFIHHPFSVTCPFSIPI